MVGDEAKSVHRDFGVVDGLFQLESYDTVELYFSPLRGEGSVFNVRGRSSILD